MDIVRADSAYMTIWNLLFMTKISLGYALRAPATFNVVKDGMARFGQPARQKSSRIIHVRKGIAILDIGLVTPKNRIRTRLIIVRRISRKKKNGVWHINTYYYGIVSNLELSAPKLFRFYHKRQGIEAGFRELKNQWHPERLPFRNPEANEFRIICKIMVMSLFKIFQKEMLPKALRTFLRKTLFRRIFQKGLYTDGNGEVRVVSESKYGWHLRRMLSKIGKMKQNIIFFKFQYIIRQSKKCVKLGKHCSVED